MLAATAFDLWAVSWAEAVGFATGGACVWLAVRQHVWTWPIGLANNVAFLVLFWQARLFADAGLQLVYFALGAYGWWNWLRGGDGRSGLAVTRVRGREWLALAVAVPLGTWGLREVLLTANGAAPLGDALTTTLSLAAQFLMCRKRLEHWWVWVAADAIYVPLYLGRDLPLTAALYGVFLVMCVAGWREWLARWRALRREGAA
jgi:nicotinamide mononucleotide transporter